MSQWNNDMERFLSEECDLCGEIGLRCTCEEDDEELREAFGLEPLDVDRLNAVVREEMAKKDRRGGRG